MAFHITLIWFCTKSTVNSVGIFFYMGCYESSGAEKSAPLFYAQNFGNGNGFEFSLK